MSLFLSGLAIYLFYRIAKWAIKGGLKAIYHGGFSAINFKWKEIRSSDLHNTLGVILFIAAVEWYFPSTSLTGLQRPEESNPKFLVSEIEFPKNEFTYAELGENTPLLNKLILSDEDFLLDQINQSTVGISKLSVELEMQDKRRQVLIGKLKLLNGQETLKDSIEQNKLERQLIFLNSRINRSSRMIKDKESSLQGLQNKLASLKAKYSSGHKSNSIDRFFPKLNGQIELYSKSTFGRPKGADIIYGPKSILSARTGNQFLKAAQGKLRHHYNPRRKVGCFLVVSEIEGQPSANRVCEVILPLPIDYDLTHNRCDKAYVNVRQYRFTKPYNDKEGAGLSCIERWKFPSVRIQYTDKDITVFEPSSSFSLEKHVYKNGLPISAWEVEYQNVRKKLKGKITFPLNKKAKESQNLRFFHLPKFVNESAISNEVADPRIWRDFYLDKVKRPERLLIESSLFLPRHKFNETTVLVKMPYEITSEVERFLINTNSNYNQQEPLEFFQSIRKSRTYKELQEKLEDFEISSASQLHNLQRKEHSVLSSESECNVSKDVIDYLVKAKDDPVKAKIIKLKRLDTMVLVQLVNKDDSTQIDCEKFNAVKKILEELIADYEVDDKFLNLYDKQF